MTTHYRRTRSGFCAIRLLIFVGLATCAACACRCAWAEPPVIPWAQRVIADTGQPGWKHQLARKALAGQCGKFTARTTAYSDDDSLDPVTGGGEWGCTWSEPGGKRLPSLLLQHGYIAADLRYWPTGTVLYAAPPFDRSWIVADCGPGVRGRTRIDVYCPDLEAWKHYQRFESRFINERPRVTVWVLGRITRQQAKG